MESVRRIWDQAREIALATPADRNRYVDFLRAASIAVVIFGHWLVAAPSVLENGDLDPGHMLAIAPWTQWLTLALQVMPIFFLVGGYANGMAWEAAQARGTCYRDWLAARLRRLIAPVIPVLVTWVALSTLALLAGVPGELVGLLSQVALVPTWFLAVYVMVGVVVPLTHRAWKRFGFASFTALVAGAVAVDTLRFATGIWQIGLVNYAFVWLAIHQLGYAWREGRLTHRLLWSAAGATALAALIEFGPYPLAMVGVPGAETSNTSPPTLALLCLGVFQTGLILRLEPFARRLLEGSRAWTSTVLVNGLIMSLYLWHMTVMIAAYGVDLLVGGFALTLEPGSATWWISRPPLMLGLLCVLVPFVGFVARFEKPAVSLIDASRRRLVSGAAIVAVGLALISEQGIASTGGMRIVPALMPFVGTGIAGFGPLAGIFAGRPRLREGGASE
jgi:hypothetical protein